MGETAAVGVSASRTAEPGQPSAFSAVSLVKRYRHAASPALDDFNLEVRPREFYGLLGPNGAGKTTAIAILTGLLPPDSGTVRVMGMSFRESRNEIKRILGLVPQNIGLYDKLTARENLAFFGKLCGIRGGELRERIAWSLEFAGLIEQAGRPIATFSFGMKRRLNLAAGLFNRPRLLVLDEPCVGIDAQSRHLIHERLRDLNRQGTSILYTTHYMEEAQELCGRIGIIDNGRLVQEGVPATLLRQNGMTNLEELFLSLTGRELRDT